MRWATEQHGQVDKGGTPAGRDTGNSEIIGDLIKLHLDDMADVDLPLKFHPD